MFEVFSDISKSFDVMTPIEAIAGFRVIMKELELANPLSIDRTYDLAVLSSSVNPVRLKNNPVNLSYEQILALYNSIVQ